MGPIVDRTKERLVATDSGHHQGAAEAAQGGPRAARRGRRRRPGSTRRTTGSARPRSCCRTTESFLEASRDAVVAQAGRRRRRRSEQVPPCDATRAPQQLRPGGHGRARRGSGSTYPIAPRAGDARRRPRRRAAAVVARGRPSVEWASARFYTCDGGSGAGRLVDAAARRRRCTAALDEELDGADVVVMVADRRTHGAERGRSHRRGVHGARHHDRRPGPRRGARRRRRRCSALRPHARVLLVRRRARTTSPSC